MLEQMSGNAAGEGGLSNQPFLKMLKESMRFGFFKGDKEAFGKLLVYYLCLEIESVELVAARYSLIYGREEGLTVSKELATRL